MMKTYQSRMTSKGQITVPADLRKELGLKPGDRVEFVREDGSIRIQRAGSVVARVAGSLSSYVTGPPLEADEIHEIAEQAIADEYMRRMGENEGGRVRHGTWTLMSWCAF